MKFIILLALVIVATKWDVEAQVDNVVEGLPEMECGPTSIYINFNTKNDFEGLVYVKDLDSDKNCISEDRGRPYAGFTLDFNTCNVTRTRSTNPKGVSVTTTVMIGFNAAPTKDDHEYKFQCFYTEGNTMVWQSTGPQEHFVPQPGVQTQVVPMPSCRYELESNSHKWICDSETVDTYCMVVHSCYVEIDEGWGGRDDLLDKDGCAVDLMMNNLEYPTDMTASVDAQGFDEVYHAQPQCHIAITIKEPNEKCKRPAC